ncbi:MAG: hypothetical protein MI919_00425 [Holophagales bacterium]|nr:hypothetical protein [Holophagales bacterium]
MGGLPRDGALEGGREVPRVLVLRLGPGTLLRHWSIADDQPLPDSIRERKHFTVASASFVEAHNLEAFCHCQLVPPPQSTPPCMTFRKHRPGSNGFSVCRQRASRLASVQFLWLV